MISISPYTQYCILYIKKKGVPLDSDLGRPPNITELSLFEIMFALWYGALSCWKLPFERRCIRPTWNTHGQKHELNRFRHLSDDWLSNVTQERVLFSYDYVAVEGTRAVCKCQSHHSRADILNNSMTTMGYCFYTTVSQTPCIMSRLQFVCLCN